MTRRGASAQAAIWLIAAWMPAAAAAQSASLRGSVSALADYLPGVPVTMRDSAPSSSTATELRLRAEVDVAVDPAPWIRIRVAGVADALAAERATDGTDVALEALESWVELVGRHGDLRAGVGRLAWGRLDEVQPTDVINPIDVARYLLEDRSAARLPVAFVRGRLIADDRFRLEGVVVPLFRRARFDRLDERTSPFNLLNDLPPPPCPPNVTCPLTWRIQRDEPADGELQGGARASVTTGRVDWSVAAWRGFVPFGLLDSPPGLTPGTLRMVHPRFTMLGADVETVRGPWAVRAEGAWFPNRPLQSVARPRIFRGDAFEAGAGVDRRSGDVTLSATLLLRREALEGGGARDNVSLAAGFSRSFLRDRVETRLFSLVNAADRAAFIRGRLAWTPMDDVRLETSFGWFVGDGDDVFTRFGDRDFVSLGARYYFGR